MNVFLSILRTIILFGAIQGFIISSLLFFSKKNRQSNRLLSVLILLISLACFNLYGEYKNWFGSGILQFITQLIPLVIAMPIGPLIYFYTKSSLDPNFKIGVKQRIQFLPAIIDMVPQLTAIIFIIGVITGLLKNNPGPWGNFIDTYNVYADIPRWISVSFYVWLSAKYLSGIKKKYNGNLNGLTASFNWVQQFIRVFLVFQAIWFLYLIPYIIPKYTDAMLGTFDWYPVYIPLAILVYWLGIKGYAISQQQSVKKITVINSPLTVTTIQETISLLNKAMQKDKLYLNPNLTLALVSENTGTPQKTISAVLNQHLHKSFNEFINEFRVEAFKKRIQQPDTDQFTIAGIAFECGFNSQATFQRTFKQIAGMSPSEFRNSAVQVH
ncbi:MAG TPA: AraC family transcriptional regulator [Puia sp.]|jgi:AraC-like DNA-binding protein|nr:AraC family transcriptional regulator [Puia sp.]